MGKLTTHVLDTANGKPGNGISGRLYAIDSDTLVTEFVTNDDGRVDEPLLSEANFESGRYELVFNIGEYFQSPDDECFLGEVVIRFHLARDEAYHVPLLVSPWSYTTYRGS